MHGPHNFPPQETFPKTRLCLHLSYVTFTDRFSSLSLINNELRLIISFRIRSSNRRVDFLPRLIATARIIITVDEIDELRGRADASLTVHPLQQRPLSERRRFFLHPWICVRPRVNRLCIRPSSSILNNNLAKNHRETIFQS